MYKIKDEVEAILPRERLFSNGADSLSEQELLAIILRTGSKNQTVHKLAAEILAKFVSLDSLKMATIEELQEVKGIGKIKAIELKAAIEFGRRLQLASPKYYGQVLSSDSLGQMLIQELSHLKQENLVVLYLDTKNKIIRKKVVFIGTVNSSTANPREILHYAVKYMATSIIISHNHPSGDPNPSKADKDFTLTIKESCSLLGINLLDHIVVGRDEYYSFRENNLL